MKIYRIDMQICATAYVRAVSETAALETAAQLAHCTTSEVEVSERAYNDPALPDVSLSPAMTIIGIYPGAVPEIAD